MYFCFMREDYLKGDQEFLDPADKEIEKALRPLSFEDFTGQDKIVENIRIFVMAAKNGVSL
jgi:holliday junction DNA helicase RuvB